MTETTHSKIHADMTMEEILSVVPAAQRALFQRYHVGGCSSCAFQPSDTLRQVCKDHNMLDVNEVVAHILDAQELDERIQVDPSKVRAWLDAGEELTFLDVRSAEERRYARIEQAELLDVQRAERYMALPKERKLVFHCKDGDRSLDVAAYFIGHGFTNVWTVRGGLDRWRRDVDSSIPKYELPTS